LVSQGSDNATTGHQHSLTCGSFVNFIKKLTKVLTKHSSQAVTVIVVRVFAFTKFGF